MLTTPALDPTLMTEEKAILRALLYFDIFHHPLTAEEITRFAPAPGIRDAAAPLARLVAQGLVFRHGDFYAVSPEAGLDERRLQGNRLAALRLRTARRISRIIAALPFVRAVLLSGSISKGYMDPQSDIDYFILTQKDRLWIVRSLLVLFRRLFLFNSHRNLCTNYFLDTDNLAIPDRNYFTAVELCTLQPMYGTEPVRALAAANGWVKTFLPACETRLTQPEDPPQPIKAILERNLPADLCARLNQWLMESSLHYWKGKYAQTLRKEEFDLAFRSRPGISKCHPQACQTRFLDRLDQRIQAFEARHGVDLAL